MGERVFVNRVSQAPGEPALPPQPLPVPETRPLVSACRHWVEPVMVLRVKPPATVTAPLNLEMPNTPKVVLGTAVPMPTLFSLALTMKVVASTRSPPLIMVEVEVCPELPTVRVEVA